MKASNRFLFLVKPETPIDLNVATIYYNSIELEWKPGGMSDVLYYNIKYRQHRKLNVDDEIISADYDESNIQTSSKELLLNEGDEDDDIGEADKDPYTSINTTNTKFKVDHTLKPFTFYEFKVSAVNMLGKSDETNTIRVRTAATSKFWQIQIEFILNTNSM